MPAARLTQVKSYLPLLAAAALTMTLACGGTVPGTFDGTGEVSGVVFDESGNPVRGATVWADEGARPETLSNSSGSYVLRDVPALDTVIRAEIEKDGQTFVGQNVSRTFDAERTRSINIVLHRSDRLASIHGTVRTSDGARVGGARVFAIASALSSAMAITDIDGNYVMRQLGADEDYQVSANAPDLRTDSTGVGLLPGEDRRVDFTLVPDGLVSTISPPSGLEAISWTSPLEATRSAQASQATEAVKRIMEPRRKAASETRLTNNGNLIEVDLFWNPIVNNTLLGYGVYRANGEFGALVGIDFYRDPLAEFYADADDALLEQQIYSYALTSINSDSEEGNFSSRVSVETLGDMVALQPLFSPLRFRWDPANGAESYVVFLFDEYPGIAVSSIWSNSAAPATGTQVAYTGPGLTSGNTYYFVVVGLANGDASRTISEVGSFTMN